MSNDDNKLSQTSDIQYVWGLISQSSAIDRERNNISLFNVIDQISVPAEIFSQNGKTKVAIDHEISLTWRRVVDLSLADKRISFMCRISLVDPSGSVLEQTTNTFWFQEKSRRTRQRIRIDGFVVTEPGDYIYRIDVKDNEADDFRKVNEIPFEVRRQT